LLVVVVVVDQETAEQVAAELTAEQVAALADLLKLAMFQ
jgi:hypothetical protein